VPVALLKGLILLNMKEGISNSIHIAA